MVTIESRVHEKKSKKKDKKQQQFTNVWIYGLISKISKILQIAKT